VTTRTRLREFGAGPPERAGCLTPLQPTGRSAAERGRQCEQCRSLSLVGRSVPEFEDPLVREVVHRPYRIVGADEVHVLTVHHSSQSFPPGL